MSFDARSRERLQALGRSLPQPLPKPEPPQQSQTKASDRRHKVELEQNPEALFKELMQVSPDGTVPPHLMERLRELESRRQSATPAPAPSIAASPTKLRGRNTAGRADRRTAAEFGDLYTAFQQLLLEDDEDIPSAIDK
ncbi:hypothetical protein KBY72_04725 [Cyanobium sp. BA5m-21]|uniref:hypothetical protein n=1 Tax=unclassified Cyanobium TaxID=2627006 RepID=UPI0020CC2DAC|nr:MULTISPECIES: hypothetical protein [unclassified Cyanobium]MCP9902933.1 hypothetical protein [Cyanobium sp. BA5m-10]MCP9906483.1 hypothetical protein [Cyanobium sp. BA5m-21]